MITDKDLKFIECIMNKMSYTDSYIQAYEPNTDNRDSIKSMACRKWNNKEIQDTYVKILQKQTDRIKIPTGAILRDLLNHKVWLEQNMCPSLASEYRRTLESINQISNLAINPIEEENSKLSQMIRMLEEDSKHWDVSMYDEQFTAEDVKLHSK